MPNLRRVRVNSSKKNNPKIFLKIVIFLLLVLFLVVAFLFYKFEGFKIKEVRVKGDYNLCADESGLIKQANLISTNLILLDKLKLTDKLRSKYSCLRAVSIKRIFPNSVEISLTQSQPVALVKVILKPLPDLQLKEASPSSRAASLNFSINDGSVSGTYIIDDKGLPVSRSDQNSSQLQVIYLETDEDLTSKNFPANSARISLAIINELKKISEPVLSAKIDDDQLLITSNEKIIFSLSGDYSREIASLQLILREAKMNQSFASEKLNSKMKKIEMIDLRFDKPVVVYSSK